MEEISISVCIPLYNQKSYAEDCIKSVLCQTFQDFEIVIYDDFSDDGVFELVQKKFSSEIATAKIRLFRNEKNLGETLTTKKCLEEARGKYTAVIHNDDLYLPNALEHLFNVAEKFNADVVHGSNFLISPKDGIIRKGTPLHKVFFDNNPANKIVILPADLNSRFQEWHTGGTFQDAQYNLFRKKFLTDNKILDCLECSEPLLFSLKWIMQAKIFVKTPEIFYVKRDNPTSQTYEKTVSYDRLEKSITDNISYLNQADKFVSNFDFFQDKKDLQYLVKVKIFMSRESLTLNVDKALGNKNHAELYNSIEKVFKKTFGESGVYLAMLYHWSHVMQFNKSKIQKMLQNCLSLIAEDI